MRSGFQVTSDFSVTQTAFVDQEIENFFVKTDIANFLSGLSGRTVTLTKSAYYGSGTGGAYYFPELWANHNPDQNGTTNDVGIWIEGYSSSFTIQADGIDGSNFTMNFGRILFHELAHAVLTPKQSDLARWSTSSEQYYEELAAFAENIYYAKAFGLPERMGHTSTATGQSVSTTSYFNGFNSPNFISTNDKVYFTSTDGNSRTIIKSYFVPGVDVIVSNGNSSKTYEYDHYTTIELVTSGSIIEVNEAVNVTVQSIIDSSAVNNSSNALAAIESVHLAVDQLGSVLKPVAGYGFSDMVSAFSEDQFLDAPPQFT